MDLTALGLNAWLEQQAAPLLVPGLSLARVTAVDRGAFLIRNQDSEMYAELAGRFHFAADDAGDLPCVGDWICIQRHASGGPAIIHSVVPRKTVLRRKRPGKAVDFQMIAANIDSAFIVQACGGDFNLSRLDRYLAMVSEGGIEPWIILTKTDLIPPEQLEQSIARIRETRMAPRILALSNLTGVGLRDFRQLLLPGKTHCLLGSSGVGKTTLINRLIGYNAFDTKAVSATGEGVHTTARRQLLMLDDGAMLIDTPGMRELGVMGTGEGLENAFSEIHEYSADCRFADCTHSGEPGCAVLLAVQNGTLSEDRYQSYLKLRKEADYHNLSYVEKRRKDRSFGRFIKSAKKQMKA